MPQSATFALSQRALASSVLTFLCKRYTFFAAVAEESLEGELGGALEDDGEAVSHHSLSSSSSLTPPPSWRRSRR